VGRKALEAWLAEPESEPQPLREEIYLKLLAARVADGDLPALLARQRRVYLQRLKDLAVLEGTARSQGRDDLVLLYQGGDPAYRSRPQVGGRLRAGNQDRGGETMTTLVELTAVGKTYDGASGRPYEP
jgi:hypothetical protein